MKRDLSLIVTLLEAAESDPYPHCDASAIEICYHPKDIVLAQETGLSAQRLSL